MSRLERDLNESRDHHRKEVDLLQEQLKLEREKNGVSGSGETSTTRMIGYSQKTKYVTLVLCCCYFNEFGKIDILSMDVCGK